MKKLPIFEQNYGLAHSFVQKLAIFSFFYILGKIRQENVFQDMLER